MRQTGYPMAPANRRYPQPRDGEDDAMARPLGLFSLALGLAQIVAPRQLARLIGVDEEHEGTIRTVGLREIASGVGILAQQRPAPWLWARVGGDAMDLALLGRALSGEVRDRSRVTAATAAVVGITLLDLLASQRTSQPPDGAPRQGYVPPRGVVGPPPEMFGMDVQQAVTIRRPREEVYRFWRDFQNLPRFMSHLESVESVDDRHSHWRARAPAGMTVAWDAETVEDRPNELIAWRSLEGAMVPNSGFVHFQDAPGDRGTEVQVALRYDPPAGPLGKLIAKLFGEEPHQQVASDLRRLKQVLEVGEVIVSDASIAGPRPAQPLPDSQPAPRPPAAARR